MLSVCEKSEEAPRWLVPGPRWWSSAISRARARGASGRAGRCIADAVSRVALPRRNFLPPLARAEMRQGKIMRVRRNVGRGLISPNCQRLDNLARR